MLLLLRLAQQASTTTLKLFLDTSFTGKDLLRTILRSGNFGNSAFGGGGYVGLDALEVAFEEASGANSVGVDRLFYQFPIGDSFTATVGGRVRQDDMLAVWPSAYPADTVLDFFTYAGAPATYNLDLGAGAGLSWESDDFSISANYLSTNGSSQTQAAPLLRIPTAITLVALLLTVLVRTVLFRLLTLLRIGVLQLLTTTPLRTLALLGGNGTPLANAFTNTGNSSSVGLSAWWSPEESGWIPSISTGWGYNSITNG